MACIIDLMRLDAGILDITTYVRVDRQGGHGTARKLRHATGWRLLYSVDICKQRLEKPQFLRARSARECRTMIDIAIRLIGWNCNATKRLTLPSSEKVEYRSRLAERRSLGANAMYASHASQSALLAAWNARSVTSFEGTLRLHCQFLGWYLANID